jgi:hypothetical protein
MELIIYVTDSKVEIVLWNIIYFWEKHIIKEDMRYKS